MLAPKVLISLGGSDPDNVTLKVIQALMMNNGLNLKVIVVVGGSNPHYKKLQSLIESNTESHLAISLQQNVNNMPELMAWADIAIAAGLKNYSLKWRYAFRWVLSSVTSK